MTKDEQALYDRVPLDGSTIGNKALRESLGWDENQYWDVRDALVTQGALVRSRGRGGSVRRVSAEEEGSEQPEDLQPEAGETPTAVAPAPELAEYDRVATALQAWGKDNMATTDFIVEKTALQGRRNTGGTWTRPDLAVVGVEEFPCVPGKFLRVATFEVKTRANFDITAVFEALAHRSAATESWVICVGKPDQAVLSRVQDEAVRHGIGVIFTEEGADDYRTWESVTEARPQEISDPQGLNEFLESQLPEAKREAIRRWAR